MTWSDETTKDIREMQFERDSDKNPIVVLSECSLETGK